MHLTSAFVTHELATRTDSSPASSTAASCCRECVDACIRQLLFPFVFDRVLVGELEMNDVNVAAENNEQSMEARDFVELGEVSKETKGFLGGSSYDGGNGWWG
jgi:hypothetical protein